MRVLVTGGAGFVGLNLIATLQDAGHGASVMDTAAADPLLSAAGHLGPRRLGPLGGDVRLRACCDHAVGAADAVVHLAAIAGIGACHERPADAWQTNVTGALNILEAARAARCPRVVLISSGAACHPHSVYGATKAAVEALGAAYAAAYGMEVVTLRPANIYGFWCQAKSSVIAAWCRALLNDQPLRLDGDGSQRRDFLFVGDLCRAILAALTVPADRLALASGRIVPVGSGAATSLLEVVCELTQIHGSVLCAHVPARTLDVTTVDTDLRAAGAALSWQPRVELADGLRLTYAWLRDVAPSLPGAPCKETMTCVC